MTNGYYSSEGSATCDICGPRYYRDGEACRPCPDGATCESTGTTVYSLTVQEGFYRFAQSSAYIHRCGFPEYACLGSRPHDTASTGTSVSATNASSNSSFPVDATHMGITDTLCAHEYTGILCSICSGDAANIAALASHPTKSTTTSLTTSNATSNTRWLFSRTTLRRVLSMRRHGRQAGAVDGRAGHRFWDAGLDGHRP